jgi:chromosome segregation ATPase
MATHGKQSIIAFIDNALDQVGDKHKRGAENRLKDDDPDRWDSSELVEWSANRAGVAVKDGSWIQYKQMHQQGGQLSVQEALSIPGALLFTFSSDPLTTKGRPSHAGVVISLGDGRVIAVTEGKGVEVIDASARTFTHAATMPGFEDSRDPAIAEQLQTVLAEHDLALPSTFDRPISPDEASKQVESLREQADQLREDAADADAAQDRRAQDREAAQELLDRAEAGRDSAQDAVARARRRVAEREADLALSSPELGDVADEMFQLKRQLGLVPQADLLIDPKTGTVPPPVPEVTDAAQRAKLLEQLETTQAKADALIAARGPDADGLRAATRELKLAELDVASAERDVARREDRVEELDRDVPQPEELLAKARELEAKANDLEGRSDEIAKEFEAFTKAHPPKDPTDLGEIEVRASAAEAFVEARREQADELDSDAREAEKDAAARRKASRDDDELGDRKAEEAVALDRRLEALKADKLRLEQDLARTERDVDRLAVDTEERFADSDRQAARGDHFAAQQLRDRGNELLKEKLDRDTEVSQLRRQLADHTSLVQQTQRQQDQLEAEAAAHEQRSDLLAEEAATLDTNAERLRARAETHDDLADTVQGAIDRGVDTTLVLTAPDEGIDVTLDIDGRAPTEEDARRIRDEVNAERAKQGLPPLDEPATDAATGPVSAVDAPTPTDPTVEVTTSDEDSTAEAVVAEVAVDEFIAEVEPEPIPESEPGFQTIDEVFTDLDS